MGTRILVQTSAVVSCGAGSARTALLYVAPSGVQATVRRCGISLNGTSSTDARATVDFIKNPSTNGTPANNESSGIKVIEGTGTSLGTAGSDYGASTNEPGNGGTSEIVRPMLVPPTGGIEVVVNQVLAPGKAFGVRTAGASGKSCHAWFEVELG